MSEYKFKNLSEINTVAEPAEGTTMMGFENGVPIQMPMGAVKGSGGVFIINPDDPEYSATETMRYRSTKCITIFRYHQAMRMPMTSSFS